MHVSPPAAVVTGIGSLPHTDPLNAIAFIAGNSPDAPFWPQLPRRAPAEYMLLQMLTPVLELVVQRSPARIDVLPGRLPELRQRLRRGPASFAERTAAGFFFFERACQDNIFLHARLFKGQLSGPLTLARCLYTESGPKGRPFLQHAGLLDDLMLPAWPGGKRNGCCVSANQC